MNPLKKKISLQTDQDHTPKKLPLIWQDVFESLLPMAESLMSQITWSVGQSAVDIMDMAGLTKAHKTKALYYGFGNKASALECIIVIEPKLAGLIRKCSFNEEVADFSGIAVKEPGRLDFLLPSLWVDQLAEAIQHIGTQHGGHEHPARLTQASTNLDFEDMSPATFVSEWAVISATFKGALGRKVKGEEFGVRIILPHADIAQSLMSIDAEAKAAGQRVDLDKCKPEIKRHLEQTPMAVRAVLEDIELSVADCARLSVGQVLPLPGVSVARLRLEAGRDQERAYLAPAELGIYKTHRAVRLNQDVAKAFIDNFVSANL